MNGEGIEPPKDIAFVRTTMIDVCTQCSALESRERDIKKAIYCNCRLKYLRSSQHYLGEHLYKKQKKKEENQKTKTKNNGGEVPPNSKLTNLNTTYKLKLVTLVFTEFQDFLKASDRWTDRYRKRENDEIVFSLQEDITPEQMLLQMQQQIQNQQQLLQQQQQQYQADIQAMQQQLESTQLNPHKTSMTLHPPKTPYKLDWFKPTEHDCDDFLLRFEFIAFQNKLSTDELKLKYFPMYLSGQIQLKVLKWIENGAHNWDTVKERFISEYREVNVLQKTYAKLGRLKQSTSKKHYTVKEVYDALELMIEKLVLYGGEQERLTTQMQIQVYTKALDSEYQQAIYEQVPPPDTLFNTFKLAHAKEDALREKRFATKDNQRSHDYLQIKRYNGMVKKPQGSQNSFKPNGQNTKFNYQRNNRQNDGPINKDIKCFICGDNHYARNCPKKQMDQGNALVEESPKSLWLPVKIAHKNMNAFLDCGASINLICSELAYELGLMNQSRHCTKSFSAVNSQSVSINRVVQIDLFISNVVIQCDVYIVEHSKFSLLLGMEFLNHMDCINFKNLTISFKGKEYKIRSNLLTDHINLVYEDDDRTEIPLMEEYEEKLNKIHLKVGKEELSDQLYSILEGFISCFDGKLGAKVPFEHQIKTVGMPKSFKPYNASFKERKIIEEEVQKMMELGIIEKSNASPYCAPVVLVSKAGTSEMRFCVDYRCLNDISEPDVYPLPRIDVILKEFHGKWYFSKIDLRKGYWQIPMKESDISKTGFVTHVGHYQYKTMPFGLKNSGKTFQKVMDFVFAPYLNTEIFVYQDDILITTETVERHMELIEEVFKLLDKYNLKVKLSKCTFLYPDAHYLGFYLNGESVSPDPERVQPILKFQKPTTLKEVQRFIGMVSYYRGSVNNFAKRAAPLYALLKKNVEFRWESEQQNAFQDLKSSIADPILLSHANFDKQFTVEVDACDNGVAALLKQENKIISMASRMLKGPELRWPVREKELYSIVFACKKFRFFLDGKNDTIIKTDHHSLSYLNTTKLSSKISRWIMFLMPFNLKIIYIQGSQNQEADLFSRLYEDTVNAIITRSKSNKDIPINKKDIIEQANLQEDEISIIHKELQHPGAIKMFKYLEDRFYNVSLSKCQQITNECIQCQRTKKTIKNLKQFKPVDHGSYPFHTISMDCIGPLTRDFLFDHEYNHILVIIDNFTKICECIPLNGLTAEETLFQIRVQWFNRYGRPYKVVMDSGSNFKNDLLINYLTNQNVDYHFTSKGYKQGNGTVERLNYTIGDYIRCNLEDNNNWIEALFNIQPVLRFSFHKSIGASPFELLTGLPANWGPLNAAEYHFKDFKTRWNIINNKSNEVLNKARQQHETNNSRDYNGLEVNDKVFIPNPEASGKLDAGFIGPYTIVELLPYHNILVDNGSRWNVNQVKKYKKPSKTPKDETIHKLNPKTLETIKSGGNVVNERRFDVIDAINHVDTPREVDKDPVMQDDLLKDNQNTLQPMNGQ